MKRPLSTIVCTSVAMMSADAMVTTSAARSSVRSAAAVAAAATSPLSPAFIEPPRFQPRTTDHGVRYDCDHDHDHGEEEEEDENSWDEDDIEMEVHSFQELQRSTGSEILDADLQEQIDQAVETPNLFLDAHVSDASYMEKIAMASIPEQLPRPALNALRQTNGGNLHFSTTARVSPQEEIELAKMIQQGVKLYRLRSDFEDVQDRKPSRPEWAKLAGLDSPNQLRKVVSNYRKAKQLLVSANLGLVHTVVKSQYYRTFKKSGLSFEELVQEGSLGLLRAAELFDPNRGLRFSTYATIWIKGQLSNSHVAQQIKLPQREKSKWNKIVRAREELIEKNDGEPTVEELADHLAMSVSEVLSTKRKMSQVQQVLSLDYEYKAQSRSGTESTSINKMESDKNFMADADLAERTQMHADVVAAMARNLNAREGRLLRLRYGLADGRQRSLSECAEAMGISQTYAQNIASKCLKKMREASDAESLEEYLLTIA